MSFIRRCLMILSPILLCGCLTAGRIENRGTNVNEGIGAMQNRAILLNLIRASRHEPLYFTSINLVTAQGSSDLKLAAPVVPTGSNLTAAQSAFSWNAAGSTYLDNSTYTNFQLGVYSTQAFYAGLLAPLRLDELDLLLHQDFSRELVLYLIIDKIKLTNAKTGSDNFLYNDPANQSYSNFVLAVKSAMEHGLTTEVAEKDDGDASASIPGISQTAPGPAAKPLKSTQSAAPGKQDRGGLDTNAISVVTAPPPTPQLCFERGLATASALTEFDTLAKDGRQINFCGDKQHQKKSQLYVRVLGADYQVEVTTRSIYGIFRYLGHLMDVPEGSPQLVDYKVPYETTPAGPILDVRKGGDGDGGCFSMLSYEGARYCVPQEGAQSTKDVFNVLTLLVALKQSPGDLPVTSSVLVAP